MTFLVQRLPRDESTCSFFFLRDYDDTKVQSACDSVDLVIATAGLSKSLKIAIHFKIYF